MGMCAMGETQDELAGRLAELEQKLRVQQQKIRQLEQREEDRGALLRSVLHDLAASRARFGPLEDTERAEAARAREVAAELASAVGGTYTHPVRLKRVV